VTTPAKLTGLLDHPPELLFKGVQSSSQYLAMRDGVQIAIDVMLPAGLAPGRRVPTLMIMARYWRSLELRLPAPPNKAPVGPREMTVDYFVPRGFAVVAVDARGTGASTGVSRHPWSPEELADYAEVARWITAQAWSSGSIGAYGISYEGATAQRLAASGVEGVKGVIPQEIEYDVYADIALPGGIFNQAFIKAWSESNNQLDNNQTSSLFPWYLRPLIKGVRPVDADRPSRTRLKQAIADHQSNTDVYAALSAITYRDDLFGSTGATLDNFSIPAHTGDIQRGGVPLFTWGSWLDGASAEAALRNLNTHSNPQIVVIGAWNHEMTGHGSPYQKPGRAPNPSKPEQWSAMAQFFAQTLIQDQPPQGKKLFYYTLGEEAWKNADAFPLPNTELQTWYFQADHRLSRSAPTADDTADTYTVDFTATTGKTNRWHTQFAKALIYPDRAGADRRLLTYTSAPLERDTEITGYPLVTLYLASTHDDGAFFVYLEDVDERGVVRYLTEGQLRGIHRKLNAGPAPYVTGLPNRSFNRADSAPLPVGETVDLTIGLQPTSALIRRGHRIRVALAGADEDTFARIPAQGAPTWKVSRGPTMASHIQLPIIRSARG
jgi:putative CocE/NonD family hydrolase